MRLAPHSENHFQASETVRDVVIGMSDGLTVPFALAAGLTGTALATTRIIVVAGLAEIAAGSIAMGPGAYLAAGTDRDHYHSEWFMNKYFPAVRSLVAERHRYCVSAETRRRRERLYGDVRSIAAELRSQNLYPSANRIVEHLPEGSCREWKALALAIREAHKAFGISK